MKVYKLSIGWMSKEKAEEVSAIIQEYGLPSLEPFHGDYYGSVSLIVSERVLLRLALIGIDVAGAEEQLHISNEIASHIEAIDVCRTRSLPSGMGGPNFNNLVQVHMPGNALSTYNELCLMEDACTDALQSKLTDGWRIIACCPQPDSRRPDYILGRFNPCFESAYKGAERA